MPTFTYKTKNSVVDGVPKITFTLRVGGHNVGSADLVKRPDETYWRLDNFKVEPKGKGYPYALTYCMLRTVEVKGGTEARIPSAHDGMIGVGNTGFTEVAGSRMMKKGLLEQVSFETNNIPAAILAQQVRMSQPKYNLQEQAAGGGSCCYITTAVCGALDLGDDCAELTALRAYRDRVLLASEPGRDDVARYYAVAPAIVAAIDRRADAPAVYAGLYQRFIAPSVAALAQDDTDRAYCLFRAMVEETASRYLPPAAA